MFSFFLNFLTFKLLIFFVLTRDSGLPLPREEKAERQSSRKPKSRRSVFKSIDSGKIMDIDKNLMGDADMNGPVMKKGIFLLTILFLVCEVYPLSYSSSSELLAFRGRRRFDDTYINLAVDKVEVDKREAARGESINFEVTIHNKGEGVRDHVTVRAVSGRRTLASTVISDFYWDVKDKMVVNLTWDTSKFEPGSYPTKVEAPLFEDQDIFDNELKLSFEIVIK
jgi:hypothetical protein